MTLWSLRVVLLLHLAQVLAQPVLAGVYLEGGFDALGAHGLNGSLLVVSGMVLVGVSVLYLIGGGVVWPLVATGVLWFGESLQVGTGHARLLGPHIPLGVAIVTVAVLLTLWAWSPAAARPRSGEPR